MSLSMHLIGYKAYRRGYIGCLAGRDAYVYFVFTKGRLKVIQRYPREDYADDTHFLLSLHKFVPRRFFLRRPLPMPSLENTVVADVGRQLAGASPSDAFLSLKDALPAAAKEKRR